MGSWFGCSEFVDVHPTCRVDIAECGEFRHFADLRYRSRSSGLSTLCLLNHFQLGAEDRQEHSCHFIGTRRSILAIRHLGITHQRNFTSPLKRIPLLEISNHCNHSRLGSQSQRNGS